ncbi:hypothetical protein HPB49_005178 [Dermacentor silvarum]|uniref:Uncharacterized protein n=1 Tax=Dermacentor silvarum TaxID=543639 RepID=A0ACB8D330_DERSI|nr:hypothetical protein HPB49_005178 [Dermacentor silvarum]
MQELFRRADPSAAESSKVSHVLRRCHPRFRPYLFGRSFSSLEELAGFAQQIKETLFWEQHYAPPPSIDVALEPACAWRETNTGTVPSYCPRPRTSVAGPDREFGSLGPSSRNSPQWWGPCTTRDAHNDFTSPPPRSTPSYQQRNPLNTRGPSRAAYRPQAPRGYREDARQAGSCYGCGQHGHYWQ